MINNLTTEQITGLLAAGVVGRIGCYTGERIYVVPISYAFDGKDIYAHTYEGMKTEAMRTHPLVCFEVDDIRDMGNWSSVIAWGKFEELKDEEERQKAIKILLNRPLPFVSSITTHLGAIWPFHDDNPEVTDGIFFRIRIEEMTGRFEKNTAYIDRTRLAEKPRLYPEMM